MASLQTADNLILSKDAVSSTGGNTATYETANNESVTGPQVSVPGAKLMGGGKKSKKRVSKKRSTNKKRKVSFVGWGKNLFRGLRKSLSKK
jgi:hypothetical protein